MSDAASGDGAAATVAPPPAATGADTAPAPVPGDAAAPAPAPPAANNDVIQSVIRIMEALVLQKQDMMRTREIYENQRVTLRRAMEAQKAAAMLQIINSIDFLSSNSTGAPRAEPPPPEPPKPPPSNGPADTAPKDGEDEGVDVLGQVTEILKDLVAKEVKVQLAAALAEQGGKKADTDDA